MYEPSLSFSIPPLDPDSPALLPSLRASQHDSSAQHVPFRLQSLAGLPDRFRLPPLLDDDYHHDNRIGSGDQAQASKGAHDDPVLHTFLSREHTLGPASELLRTSLQANFARVPDELWNDEPGRSAHQERLPRSATSSDSQSDSEIYEDRGEGSSSSGRMLQPALLTWDTFRPESFGNGNDGASSAYRLLPLSPFISDYHTHSFNGREEDSADTIEALLQHLDPVPASSLLAHGCDGDSQPQRYRPAPTHPPNLVLASLLATASSGTSSALFRWDAQSARFAWAGELSCRERTRERKARGKGKAKDLNDAEEAWWGAERIEGWSAPASDNVVGRFLRVGTALRRLEMRIAELRATPEPVEEVHALAHALDTALAWLHDDLATYVSVHNEEDSEPDQAAERQRDGASGKQGGVAVRSILAAWNGLQQTEELLVAFAELCLCPPARPPPFKPWPSTTAMLISHVHAHLAAAVVSHSSPLVQALLAWLLQKTSMAWRQSVSAWVGWPGASASAKEPRLVTRGDRGVQKTQPWSGAEVEWALNERGEEDVGYILRPARLPAFISLSDARDLLEAGRALRLLRKAASNGHPVVAMSSRDSSSDGPFRARNSVVTEGARHDALSVPSWSWNDEQLRERDDLLRVRTRSMRRDIARWRRKFQGRSVHGGSASTSTMPSSDTMETQSHPHDSIQANARRSRAGPLTTGISSSLSRSGLNGEDAFKRMFSLFDSAPGPKEPVPETGEQQALSAKSEAAPRSRAPPTNAATPRDELMQYMAQVLSSRPSTDSMFQNGYVNAAPWSLLPPLCPSMVALTQRSLVAPLLEWSKLINSALISVFFRDLGLGVYLETCRQFLLLGSPAFAARVKEALFESDEDEEESRSHPEWGIGLSKYLNSGSAWPPGGSELSSALNSAVLETVSELRVGDARRTALDEDVDRQGRSMSLALHDLDERLSFAIAEPERKAEAHGRAEWRDPQSIEALDWLTLSFHPPPLISPLITQLAQTSYQRIFNFLLRLMRVQTVLRSLFTETLKQQGSTKGSCRRMQPPSKQKRMESKAVPLFEGDTASRQLLMRFRTQAQHFATALGSFVFDIAVESAWTRFHRRLTQLRQDAEARDDHAFGAPPSAETDTETDIFQGDDPDDGVEGNVKGQEEQGAPQMYELKDVFSLARYHERVLDRMMQTCFLKQRQRGVMKIITDLFEAILALGRLVRELRLHRIDEITAAQNLTALHARFSARLSVLLRALQLIRERGAGGSRSEQARRALDREMDAQAAARARGGWEGGKGSAPVSAAARAEQDRQQTEADRDLRMLETEGPELLAGNEHGVANLMARLDLQGFYR